MDSNAFYTCCQEARKAAESNPEEKPPAPPASVTLASKPPAAASDNDRGQESPETVAIKEAGKSAPERLLSVPATNSGAEQEGLPNQVTLQVQVSGRWIYQITQDQLKQMISQVKGKRSDAAQPLLLRQKK